MEHDTSRSLAATTCLRRAIIMPPGHELRRRVDRLDRLNGTVCRQMEDRECPVRGVAADHDLGDVERQAGDLQPDVVLVGPEPGHLGRRRRPAAQIGGGLLGLLQRVRHAFQPDGPAVQRQRPMGAVADGVDGGVGGARGEIDDDAVRRRQARRRAPVHHSAPRRRRPAPRRRESPRRPTGARSATRPAVALETPRTVAFRMMRTPASA